MTLSAMHWNPNDEDFRISVVTHYIRSANKARRCKGVEETFGASFYNDRVRTVIDQMSDDQLLGRGRTLQGAVNRLAREMEVAYPQLRQYHYRFRSVADECISPEKLKTPNIAKPPRHIEFQEGLAIVRAVPASTLKATEAVDRDTVGLAFLDAEQATYEGPDDFSVEELRAVAKRHFDENTMRAVRRDFRKRVVAVIQELVPPIEEDSMWDVVSHYVYPLQGNWKGTLEFIGSRDFPRHLRDLTRSILAYEALSPEEGDPETEYVARLRALYLRHFDVLTQGFQGLQWGASTFGIEGPAIPTISERERGVIDPIKKTLATAASTTSASNTGTPVMLAVPTALP